MKILKRNERYEAVKFDKILGRIKKQTYGLSDTIDAHVVSKVVIEGLYDGVSTVELDKLAAETAFSLSKDHPDYAILAGRIAISALHKRVKKPFSETIDDLYNYIHPKTNERAGMIADDVYAFIKKHSTELNEAIVFDRDFNHDYFGFKTLEKSYLLKIDGLVAETPQHMWMRVACGIWNGNVEEVIKTYDLMSQGYFTHASPTLFNSGTKRPQLSSCFLLTMSEDSLECITDTWKDMAYISKNAGGIGIDVGNIRARGSYIKGTNGTSNGLLPMIQVINQMMRYIDQGGQKRKGSAAIYVPITHPDVEDIIDIRKTHGSEDMRARDLFPAMWVNDLFMRRVEADEDWTFMSPDECPGLNDVYDEQIGSGSFTDLYTRYEQAGRGKKKIKARELMAKIIEAQIETGTPYMVFKDTANRRSNQKNVGVIKSSNLCVEIYEVANENETAVCNLASIALPKYLKQVRGHKEYVFDHQSLFEVAYQITKNLNRVIDVNFYPTEKTKTSNMKMRPISIGVQGLADVFARLKIAFDSEEAKQLNKEIFQTIYFATLSASTHLAKLDGAYKSFKGSPAAEGILQYHMAGLTNEDLNDRWDWSKLIEDIKSNGLRNSLHIGLMPTSSTSNILGNNECFEPFTSLIYLRTTLSGKFAIVNKHLVRDLTEIGLWNTKIRDQIILNDGSIQSIVDIPDEIKNIYKNAWEIKQRVLIDMAADRGAFVDQGQSMNLFMANANVAKISSALFHAWKSGLKTGSYYIHTKSVMSANKGLAMDIKKEVENQSNIEGVACSLDSPEDCISCGS